MSIARKFLVLVWVLCGTMLVQAQTPSPVSMVTQGQTFTLEALLHYDTNKGVESLNQIIWSPDGTQLILVISEHIYLYNIANLNSPPTIIDANGLTDAHLESGDRLLIGKLDRITDSIRWYDLQTNQAVVTKIDNLYAVFSPDGHYIVTTGARGLRLWDAKTEALLIRAQTGTHTIEATFNRDGTRIATLGQAGLELWTLYPGPLMTQDTILRLGLSWNFSAYPIWGGADGNLLAFQKEDTVVGLYDAATEKELDAFENIDSINSLAFDPTGILLAVSSDRGTRIWNTETRALFGELTINNNHYNPGQSLRYFASFSRDGSRIAIGNSNGDAAVYHVNS